MTALLAEAKGVAGLGKAGGDGQGGSDKAGQQVPPEVYMALTYAGTLFLFTLSVPLILYGLNKLLNKIEDCFGCGPSSRAKRAKQKELLKQKSQMSSKNDSQNGNNQNQPLNSISSLVDQVGPPDSQSTQNSKHSHQNQRLHLQMLQQHPKYTQFISMSNPDYKFNGISENSSSLDKVVDLSPAMVPVTTSAINNHLQHKPVSLQSTPPSTRQSQNGANSFALNMPVYGPDSSKSKT